MRVKAVKDAENLCLGVKAFCRGINSFNRKCLCSGFKCNANPLMMPKFYSFLKLSLINLV